MLNDLINIRPMKEQDYEEVRSLWMTIKGFGIRTIDDSRESIVRFIRRNRGISCVAETQEGEIIGAVLCGHDGRTGCFYHVCVDENYRLQGIGKQMVIFCREALEREGISKITLIAFKENPTGNVFWKKLGWEERMDVNRYDFTLNDENRTNFIR